MAIGGNWGSIQTAIFNEGLQSVRESRAFQELSLSDSERPFNSPQELGGANYTGISLQNLLASAGLGAGSGSDPLPYLYEDPVLASQIPAIFTFM